MIDFATEVRGEDTPATQEFTTKELKTHNHLLGDLAALNQAWERDGYWFFRDVLDKGAVGRLRDEYIRELERFEVIDPVGDASTERSVEYNGKSLEGFPFRMEPLAAREPWRAFAAEPPIHDFFTRLFEDEPFWVPVAEYRATPPAQNKTGSRLDGIHQDGPYSPGIPFRICWIPLAEIDEDVGGLVLAEGLTEKINRHPPNASGSHTMVPLENIPADRWRHTTYRAGDLLLMNLWTPHSGVTNVSNRFRLSMDHRIMARGDRCPIVGEIVSITPEGVEARDKQGVHRFSIDADTYVRNHMGEKLSGDDIARFFQPSKPVIIAFDGKRASVVRPTH